MNGLPRIPEISTENLRIKLITLDKLSKVDHIYTCNNVINTKAMKRQYRELSDETKAKISQSMRGKSKSFMHREAISNGLKDYWATIPNKPTTDNKVG